MLAYIFTAVILLITHRGVAVDHVPPQFEHDAGHDARADGRYAVTQRRAARWLPALCLVFALLFGALGVWQVERLRWKLDLIERVETRLAQPAIAAPMISDPSELEYRPVRASGTFLHERETLVQALTERGAGFLGDDAAPDERAGPSSSTVASCPGIGVMPRPGRKGRCWSRAWFA